VEQQIASLVRATGQEPQGLICPHILVREDAVDDPSGAELVQSTVEFVNWAMSDAQLLPGEFPAEAFCAYFADYYLAQVNNGGHGQWAGNSGFNPLVVKPAGWALEAMGASEYLEVYRDFMRMMDDKTLAAAIIERGGFGERSPAEDDIDDRFYALDVDFSYPMLKKSGAWLRALPCLRPLAPEELSAACAEVEAANPFRSERLANGRRIQEEQVLYRIPRKLCADAKITFDRLTAGQPVVIDGRSRFGWYMVTNLGLMLIVFFKGSVFGGAKARLYHTDAASKAVGTPIAETSISGEDYRSAVPARYDPT
jgi:hypothetical protein